MNTCDSWAGSWTGTNGFRLMPHEELATAESTAAVRTGLRGWGTELRYTWIHPSEGEQEGLLLISSPDDEDTVNAALLDTFHQKPKLGILSGTTTDSGVSLAMEYMGWGWTVEVSSGANELRMTMCNVIPEGVEGAQPGPYPAMEAVWTRSDAAGSC